MEGGGGGGGGGGCTHTQIYMNTIMFEMTPKTTEHNVSYSAVCDCHHSVRHHPHLHFSPPPHSSSLNHLQQPQGLSLHSLAQHLFTHVNITCTFCIPLLNVILYMYITCMQDYIVLTSGCGFITAPTVIQWV